MKRVRNILVFLFSSTQFAKHGEPWSHPQRLWYRQLRSPGNIADDEIWVASWAYGRWTLAWGMGPAHHTLVIWSISPAGWGQNNHFLSPLHEQHPLLCLPTQATEDTACEQADGDGQGTFWPARKHLAGCLFVAWPERWRPKHLLLAECRLISLLIATVLFLLTLLHAGPSISCKAAIHWVQPL